MLSFTEADLDRWLEETNVTFATNADNYWTCRTSLENAAKELNVENAFTVAGTWEDGVQVLKKKMKEYGQLKDEDKDDKPPIYSREKLDRLVQQANEGETFSRAELNDLATHYGNDEIMPSWKAVADFIWNAQQKQKPEVYTEIKELPIGCMARHFQKEPHDYPMLYWDPTKDEFHVWYSNSEGQVEEATFDFYSEAETAFDAEIKRKRKQRREEDAKKEPAEAANERDAITARAIAMIANDYGWCPSISKSLTGYIKERLDKLDKIEKVFEDFEDATKED